LLLFLYVIIFILAIIFFIVIYKFLNLRSTWLGGFLVFLLFFILNFFFCFGLLFLDHRLQLRRGQCFGGFTCLIFVASLKILDRIRRLSLQLLLSHGWCLRSLEFIIVIIILGWLRFLVSWAISKVISFKC